MNTGTQLIISDYAQGLGQAAADISATVSQSIDETLHEMIAEEAYFLAKDRSFADGYAIDDWLKAEKRINVASAE